MEILTPLIVEIFNAKISRFYIVRKSFYAYLIIREKQKEKRRAVSLLSEMYLVESSFFDIPRENSFQWFFEYQFQFCWLRVEICLRTW